MRMTRADKGVRHGQPANAHQLVPYGDVRGLIRDADLLLFRRRSLISVAGRGEHSHAAKAAWWGPDLFSAGDTCPVRQPRCDTVQPSQTVPRAHRCLSGEPDDRWPEYDRAGATRFMRAPGRDGLRIRRVVVAALYHVPFVRLLVRPEMDDKAVDSRPPFCSHACAMADRIGGGVDPFPIWPIV